MKNTKNYTGVHEAVFKSNTEFDKDIDGIKEMLKWIKDTARLPLVRNKTELFDIFSHEAHLMLVCIDILIAVKHANACHLIGNKTEELFFARVIALNCHEWFNDINKFTWEFLRKNNSDSRATSLINDISNRAKEISKFKKQNANKVSEIRHRLIGHRLGTGIEQIESMEKIDMNEIISIAMEIISHTAVIGKFIIKLLPHVK